MKDQLRPRRLLLCLDGVPYDLIVAAKDRGLFERFGAPARLLSPFPTMTNIALSTMLGATAPLGYESLYFDRNARELRGGISKYIGRRTPDKLPSSYMDDLDYQEPLPFEFLVYVAPETVWRADMKRFRDRFRAAPQNRDYFAFLKGTDGLLHIRGPRRLNVALQSLDRILREIQDYCGIDTEIVLFSDHGMNLEENRRVHLQTHLKRRGYELVSQLNHQGRKSVAVPAFGLCGYAALYGPDEETASKIADELRDLDGVDFALHRAGTDSIAVKGASGVALIGRRINVGTSYRYRPVDGDPLHLRDSLTELARNSLTDAEGFAGDDVWYARTADHIYPDALANLFNSVHTHRVGHTADVLVSMKDGYYYGSSLFGRFVTLAATHGNAMRSSTSAFLMSTHRPFPGTVRASEARAYLKG
jgi:Type I phosphodiesterase / nucleotide pyrophosphatase